MSLEVNFGINKYKAIRGAYSRYMWSRGFPQDIPTATLNQNSLGYGSLGDPNCVRVDKLTCALDSLGNTDIVHLLYPKVPVNRCVVMHGGHSQDYYSTGQEDSAWGRNQYMVKALLGNGYHVLGVNMPFQAAYSSNYNMDGLNLSKHSDFYLFEKLRKPTDKSVLSYYLEPVFQAINYVEANFDFLSIDMTGISGGGWSTYMCAGLDTRIRRSYPVFGGLTFELVNQLYNASYISGLGDYEQRVERPWWPTLENTYENIYILACLEPGRRLLQIVGDYDTAFPVLSIHTGVDAYEAYVQSQVPSGNFEIWNDTYVAGHYYTDEAIAQIILDLAV